MSKIIKCARNGYGFQKKFFKEMGSTLLIIFGYNCKDKISHTERVVDTQNI